MDDRMFQQQFHIRLNAQQEAAVRQTEGPVLLLAVPGSGKTTVLVTRLGYLLYCRGVRPENILTVTYTVAATKDMTRRFSRVFGEEYARRLTFSTINSLCAKIIHYYARAKKSQPFALADSDAKLNGVIRDLLVKTGSDYPSELQVKEARTHITYCKNMMLTEAEIHEYKVEGMDFPAVYFEYQDYMIRSKLMDFDDQMVFAYRVLRKHPDILAYYQRKYRYICVDEAQDTSKIQHVILRLLASEHRNIFLVGDEDQSIYGFRAAWPQALLEFEETWPGAAVLLMENNYRSTRAIVERADSFIQRNRERHPKHMSTDNAVGEPIRKIVLGDFNRQYNYLLQAARDCRESTAVLFRNNDSALPLIDLLEQNKIPYSCRQREGFFFTSPLVRDITDMLEFAFDDCNGELFLHFYYKLDLRLKKVVLTDVLRHKMENETVLGALLECDGLEGWQLGKIKALQTHFSKFPQLTSFAAIQRLVRFMGYGDYLKEQHADTSKLDILLALANQTPSTGPFLLRLRALRELIAAGTEPEDCPFVLSTIHASKGLEYDRVILIDVVDGVFPNAPVDEEQGLSGADQAALEEERRLFYVAVTRAKYHLEVLSYEGKFGEPAGVSSTFVTQLLGEEPKKAETDEGPRSARRTPVRREPTGPTAEQIENWSKDYIPGTYVQHKKFGKGLIRSKEGDTIVVAFMDGSTRKLLLSQCLRGETLSLSSFL